MPQPTSPVARAFGGSKPATNRGRRKTREGRSREGSVDQLPSGWWRARVTDEARPAGDRRVGLGTFETEAAAWTAIHRWHGVRSLDLHIDDRLAATQVSAVWESLLLTLGGNEGTRDDRKKFADRCIYGTSSRTHSGDVIGTLPVAAVTRGTVAAMARSLRDGGLGDHTVNKFVRFVSMLLDHAVDERMVRTNPIAGARGKRGITTPVDSRPHYIYEPSEIVLLVLAMPPQHALMAEAILFGGMRQMEVRTLMPRALNARVGMVAVEDSKTRSSVRRVPLPTPLLAALVAHADELAADALLWPRPSGGPMTASDVAQVWGRARERAGLLGDPRDPMPGRRRPPTAHDARATAASWLSAAGVPLAEARAYLGHSTAEMTIEVYTEVADTVSDHPVLRACRAEAVSAAEVMARMYAAVWDPQHVATITAGFNADSAHKPNRGGRPKRKPGEPWNVGDRARS